MKALKCEMCDSTDLVKDGDFFVCQNCGTKYTVETAKKMMFEGTVDVSGSTVKVDNTDKLDNLYQIARRAKDDNNSENAAKYYDMILVEDPKSWEASFYVVYFKAVSCKIAYIQSAAYSISNCIESVLNLIKSNICNSEQLAAVTEVSSRSQLASIFLYEGAKNHYNSINSDIKSNYTKEWLDNACAARDILYVLGNQISAVFGEKKEYRELAISAWRKGINLHNKLLPSFANKEANRIIMESYSEKIVSNMSEFSIEECLAEGIRELQVENGHVAIEIFERLIIEQSIKPLAYLGKAVAYAMMATVEDEKKCVECLHESEDNMLNFDKNPYLSDIEDIISSTFCNGYTTLMIVANQLDEKALRFLLSLGANVNARTSQDATALWVLAHKAHPGKEAIAAEAAKVLLDAGAETNVTTTGLVSLLNSETDYLVKQAILNKNPNTKQGYHAGTNGCYVATCVYGSYDCPEVWTLRRFRDYDLAETWYGRTFIRTYYTISPTIVKWFGDTDWFKNMWRGTLDKMVTKLQNKGYESTPYNDREW